MRVRAEPGRQTLLYIFSQKITSVVVTICQAVQHNIFPNYSICSCSFTFVLPHYNIPYLKKNYRGFLRAKNCCVPLEMYPVIPLYLSLIISRVAVLAAIAIQVELPLLFCLSVGLSVRCW